MKKSGKRNSVRDFVRTLQPLLKIWSILICVSLFLSINPNTHAQEFTHAWSNGFGDLQDQSGNFVVVDSLNNAIITGSFEGIIDFGGGNLTSAGTTDVYLAKFDTSGNHQWSKSFGDSSDQNGTGLAIDSLNNIIIVGYFDGTIDLGGGSLISADPADIFLAKFDSSGNHIWSKKFGDLDSQKGYSIAVDIFDNILITGHFQYMVDFGGSPLTSAGGYDIFLAKFDATGNHQWSHSFGESSSQEGLCVVTDSVGHVYMTGGFDGSVDFGGGVLTSSGGTDIFLATFDASGNHLWSKKFGDSSSQKCRIMAVDSSENIIITGEFVGTVDFGGDPLTSTDGSYDIYLVKFDSMGNCIWSSRYGDWSDEVSYGIYVDSSDSIIITGLFFGPLNFGNNPLMSTGACDVFLAKFDSMGTHVWSNQYGDSDYQGGISLACDNLNNIILLGVFAGSINFGSGPLISAGGSDIFLAKFDKHYYTPTLSQLGIFILLLLISIALIRRF